MELLQVLHPSRVGSGLEPRVGQLQRDDVGGVEAAGALPGEAVEGRPEPVGADMEYERALGPSHEVGLDLVHGDDAFGTAAAVLDPHDPVFNGGLYPKSPHSAMIHTNTPNL